MRFLYICLILAGTGAYAGTLQMGPPEVDGGAVVIPVFLQGDVGGGVAAMDFTVNYDPSVLKPTGAIIGPVAQSAQKDIQFNEKSNGEYVVMLFGLNQSTIQSGRVAEIRLERVGDGSVSETQVSIGDTTLASPSGDSIASSGSAAQVTFPTGTPNPTPGGNDGGTTDPDDEPPTTPTPTEPAEPDTPGSGPGSLPVVNPPDVTSDTPSEPRIDVPVSAAGSGGAPVDLSQRVARLRNAAQALDASRASLPNTATGPFRDAGSTLEGPDARSQGEGEPKLGNDETEENGAKLAGLQSSFKPGVLPPASPDRDVPAGATPGKESSPLDPTYLLIASIGAAAVAIAIALIGRGKSATDA